MLGFVAQAPVEEVEQLFGYMIAFLQALGLWDWVIGAMMVWIVLGLTMRFFEAIGGKS